MGANSKKWTVAYWIVTVILCLQMSFTAYAQLRLPVVAQAFERLGFPSYFRIELAWAKIAAVIVLLFPFAARLKEWAYVGFAIVLVSALIAHFALGEGAAAWSFAAGASVLWGVSYFLWIKLQGARIK